MEYRYLGRTGVACDALVPPGTHVANFFNTSGWMRASIG